MGPWDHHRKKNTFFHTSLLTNVKASPAAPARPVLPTPWVEARVTWGVGGTDGNRRRPKIQSNWY